MKKSLIVSSALILCLAVIAALSFSGCTPSNPSISEKIENGATEQDVSQEVSISAPQGNYSIKFTAVYEAMPDTDEPEPPEAQRVVVVVYEYTNRDVKDGLAISDTHFKAFDKDGNQLAGFPQKGLFEPGQIGEEGTRTASVAFAFNSEENFIEVDYYNDPAAETPDTVFTSEF